MRVHRNYPWEKTILPIDIKIRWAYKRQHRVGWDVTIVIKLWSKSSRPKCSDLLLQIYRYETEWTGRRLRACAFHGSWVTRWMTTHVLEIMDRNIIANLFFTRKEVNCKSRLWVIISCLGWREGDTGKKHSGGKGEGGRVEADTQVCESGCHSETEKTQAAARKVSLALDMPREGQLSEDTESIAWYLVFGSEAQERNLG